MKVLNICLPKIRYFKFRCRFSVSI